MTHRSAADRSAPRRARRRLVVLNVSLAEPELDYDVPVTLLGRTFRLVRKLRRSARAGHHGCE